MGVKPWIQQSSNPSFTPNIRRKEEGNSVTTHRHLRKIYGAIRISPSR